MVSTKVHVNKCNKTWCFVFFLITSRFSPWNLVFLTWRFVRKCKKRVRFICQSQFLTSNGIVLHEPTILLHEPVIITCKLVILLHKPICKFHWIESYFYHPVKISVQVWSLSRDISMLFCLQIVKTEDKFSLVKHLWLTLELVSLLYYLTCPTMLLLSVMIFNLLVVLATSLMTCTMVYLSLFLSLISTLRQNYDYDPTLNLLYTIIYDWYN